MSNEIIYDTKFENLIDMFYRMIRYVAETGNNIEQIDNPKTLTFEFCCEKTDKIWAVRLTRIKRNRNEIAVRFMATVSGRKILEQIINEGNPDIDLIKRLETLELIG